MKEEAKYIIHYRDEHDELKSKWFWENSIEKTIEEFYNTVMDKDIVEIIMIMKVED